MITFGTGGFRALMSEDFTKENVQKVAQSLAKIIKKEKSNNPVIIGYDRRFMSDFFAKWFAEVLAGNKIVCKLYNRPVPTPNVMYGVMSENLDYGVTITASHNPYMYNGIKITTKGGIDANIEFTNKITKMSNRDMKIKSIDFYKGISNKLIVDYDNTKEYIRNLTKQVSKEIKNNNIKLLFNAMHGTTVENANILDKRYNLKKFTLINDDADPFFEHQLPSPNQITLEKFAKEVTKGKYSIGIACDGDGDRIAIIDELGNFHNCNIIIAIVYYYLVKYRAFKGDVVKNMSTSCILDKLADAFGYKCHEVPVGFKWVSTKMLETDALVGGEVSGGLTIKGFTPCKDSMLAMSLVLDAMAIIKKPLSQIINEIKEFCGYISTYVEDAIIINSRKKVARALRKVVPNFPYKPIKSSTVDGIKYYFEDGSYVHIRFSGTEDLLRYQFEFPTEVECERTLKAIKDFIKTYDKH